MLVWDVCAVQNSFGTKDCSGFLRQLWPARQLKEHVDACHKLKACKTATEIERMETETGIKYN